MNGLQFNSILWLLFGLYQEGFWIRLFFMATGGFFGVLSYFEPNLMNKAEPLPAKDKKVK